MVSSLLSFAAFVFAPELSGSFNIPLLSLLRSTTQKDDQNIAFSTKVDPIAPKSIRHSKTPAPTPLALEKLPSFILDSAFCHSGRGLSVEPIEPSGVGVASVSVDVFYAFDHKCSEQDTIWQISTERRWQEDVR